MNLTRRAFLARLTKGAVAAPFVLRAAPQAVAPVAEPLHEILEARETEVAQLESLVVRLASEDLVKAPSIAFDNSGITAETIKSLDVAIGDNIIRLFGN